ncbi:MBL fold metallo-hydrolase [Crassaminicella thermophila]|uniref:MBL fold metallo-hydrolase n=1 Tax=Crassaminicella thermophila TaxID=2599308 RepID=A0A5C0SFG7_CRATE|nr:MBL fold metallo-hydrolase [Crassaminicella thermophila]QEK12074.1 MBL fold metallo-hydrolase [Crassaminicella thermophila]
MILERIPAGIYAVNCFVLACKDTKKACVIDPGGDAEEILNYIKKNDLDLAFILLTHAHGDHIGGIPKIKEKIDIPVLVHEDDGYMLSDGNKNLSNLMSGPNVEIVADRLLKDGESIELGNLKLQIIHTPGHTRGSICIKVDNILFTGDTLFANSIGRTDLEGGSFEKIIDSIKRKLLVMDDNIKVLPGHGPMSTIGIERLNNPFINK